MFQHGQRIERHEVEPWVAEAFPHPWFLAEVVEKEEPQHNRVRVSITITGPNGEALVANNRKPVYFSLRALPGMLQFSDDWTA
jgi:hypothetical protein